MITDVNGYVVVKSYQVIPVEADAFAEIQNALNSAYRVIFIGDTNGDYEISQPVYYSSNKTIILKGKITIKNGVTSLVTANVSSGATSFSVVNASLFHVGEWVAITDDAQLNAYDTFRGSSGKITDITDNTITFDSVCTYNYLTAQNAYVGHVQGVLIGESPANVKIIGIGAELNGNRTNQSQIHPVRNVSVIEDQRAACGLVVYKGTNITINGLVVKDSLLHNYSVTSLDAVAEIDNTNITITNCEGYNGHDKNFLIRDVDGCTITNIIANDATWEDGIIFYVSCLNIAVNGVYAEGNNRSGFYWNSNTNSGLVASNITTRDNTRGVYIVSKDAVISDVDSNDMMDISDQYTCQNIVLNNINLHDVTANNCLYLRGGISDIEINNLTINDSSAIGIKSIAVSGNYPSEVVITVGGIYNHTGIKTSIAEGSDITFNNFEGLT